MSRQFARLMQHRTRRKKGDTAQLAAQLAPLEEQDRAAAEKQIADQGLAQPGSQRERGAIVVDTDHLALPKDIRESEGRAAWRIEPVVIVIVGLMLLFIAFVAWQITLMPQ